ncbi:hypothetical protein IQ07DRAFT_593478 [Pyrenochaeta sp. DS3sAY3a]|nr:hypothetical protein IQ07DRAFT_593478 [Pyrenochaeta sp. DS3sAY3a]
MSFLASSAVLLLAGVAGVAAGPAPHPAVTPAALLPRDNTQTLGWYSDGQTNGQTIYAPWVFDADSTTYTTSSNWFRRCGVSTTCVMYTGCSNGYMVAASGQSTYCGLAGATGGATTNYCSNHVILPTLGASTGSLSWYWCDDAPLTGYTFYASEPAQPTITDANSTPTRSASAPITSDSSFASPSNTASPSPSTSTTPPPASSGSSTPVGAIAGGVVGGVAALGAIAFAVFFLLRRDKKRKAANQLQTAPLMGGTAPGYQAGQPGYPAGVQQAGQPGFYDGTAYQSEAKPQGVGVGGQPQYYPQSYPMGPYDPHVQQQGTGYAGSPGATGAPIPELGTEGYAPTELPAQGKIPK